MKTLYLDIFSGISGDMFIGAMLDLGVDLKQLEKELEKLKLGDYHVHAGRATKATIEGVKFDVHLEEDHHHDDHDHDEHGHHSHHHHEDTHATHDHAHSHGSHENEHEHHHDHAHEHEHTHGRTFSEIKALISRSTLSTWVKQKAVAVFHRVAVAEGKIHGKPPEAVHFHEVGAVDSIIDIVGACVALELLGTPRVLSAPVVEGIGWINCAHGRFPIPAPATLGILAERKIPISQCEEPAELVTPTGAAILAEFAEGFGPMQNLTAERVGYGLGTRNNKTRPNVLRAVLGQSGSATIHDWETDTIVTVQSNLDDVSSEILGNFMEQAFAAGALDVFYTPIQMKKNRPGILLSVLCTAQDAEKFSELIVRETSAFGVRRFTTERRKLKREINRVRTPFGEVEVKIGRLDGKVVQVAPEFESCRSIAQQAGVPLKQVFDAAAKAAQI
jgi:uncharacterized protein (TIGR00299 family) protein